MATSIAMTNAGFPPRRFTSQSEPFTDHRSHLWPSNGHATGTTPLSARRNELPAEGVRGPLIDITPAEGVTRHTLMARGVAVEIVESASNAPAADETAPETTPTLLRMRGQAHLLIACERGSRSGGDTTLEGVPKSTLRDRTRKLTVVPAGSDFRDRLEAPSDLAAIYVYFDPAAFGANDESAPAPRLFFDSPTIWDTVLKIKAAVTNPVSADRSYVEALAHVLWHEIMRANAPAAGQRAPSRGGLAAWQQRKIAAFIEEHFAEPLTLAAMAKLVGLSPYYFCRAFKQSFGMPPRRYLSSRRIERAKRLLIEHKQSVTHIALEVGFDETSSFSAAFRKATGLTPTSYQRTVG